MFFKRFSRSQSGFTLIELLVVVAILGILASTFAFNVTGFIGRGQKEAAATEFASVQTAVDCMMVSKGFTVVPVTASTSDMAGFPAGSPLYPEYTRTQTTKGSYSCDGKGKVTQEKTGY